MLYRVSLFIIILSQIIYSEEKGMLWNPQDLKPGMKGYALTVFQGLEPEKIDVEIIEFMPKKFAGTGLVLVKLSGENIERSRVAQGMSGSPVYIDGKLVGALAYTWRYARELLAGVTPIHAMIADKKRGENTTFLPMFAEPIQTAWFVEGMDSKKLIQKLQTVSCGDFYPKGVEEFIKVSSSRINGVAPLKPGDSVAIKLVEGDVTIGGIGTVTYVDGEDVYIFGHPMDGDGPIALPLSRAYVYDIMSSIRLSFKMAVPLSETIGSVVFDGQHSVYGRFDLKSPMLPVSVHINGSEYHKSYHMSMARSRKYLPTLLGIGIGDLLEKEVGNNIEKKMELSWRIELTNDQVITNAITWIQNIPEQPLSLEKYWNSYISLLWNNPLVHLVPEKLIFNVDIVDKPCYYYTIVGLKTTRDSYLPNDTITLQIMLKGYLDEITYKNIAIKLPKNMQAGVYQLIVANSVTLESELSSLFPEFYKIRTPKQLINELNKPMDMHKINLVLLSTTKGCMAGNVLLKNIPESRISLFQHFDNQGNPFIIPKFLEKSILMKEPVLGIKKTTLEIYPHKSINLSKY